MSSPSSSSPFPLSDSTIPEIRPGDGRITVEFDPYRGHTFTHLSCTYPLKLLSPRSKEDSVAIVYVLSYGGGLVGGDEVDLDIAVREGASLMLLSQVRSPSHLWCRRTLVLIFSVGFHQSVQGQVHEPLSHSNANSPTSLNLTHLNVIESSDLSTHDCADLKRRYILPPSRPRNLLQTRFVQPTPNIPSRRRRVTRNSRLFYFGTKVSRRGMGILEVLQRQ